MLMFILSITSSARSGHILAKRRASLNRATEARRDLLLKLRVIAFLYFLISTILMLAGFVLINTMSFMAKLFLIPLTHQKVTTILLTFIIPFIVAALSYRLSSKRVEGL